MNCKYFMQSCLTWILNNKIVTLLSLLSFCLFVSTLAMAGQRNRLNDRLVQCHNSIANIESTTDNAVTLTTDSEDTSNINTETTTKPEVETTTEAETTETPKTTEPTENPPPNLDPQTNIDDEQIETKTVNDEANDERPNAIVVKNEIIGEQNENKLPDGNTNEESVKNEAAVNKTPEKQVETVPAVDVEPGKQVAMKKKRDLSDTYESALINRILALATAS